MKIQNFISNNESAQYFESGYSCDNALFLKLGSEKIFITDSRYTTEARENLKSGVALFEAQNLIDRALEILKNSKITNLTFDPTSLCVSDYQKLESSLKIKLKPQAHFHQIMRAIKTPKEIELIKKSQKLNKKAYKIFAKSIEAGMSERKLHALARNALECDGEYELSFNPIVAINGSAAKPHALPSLDTRLKNGDLLLFDAGIKFKRYCSDRTRTAFFDAHKILKFKKHQFFKDSKLQKIYDIVLKAQEHTIKSIRAGMSGKQIDALARDVITKTGFGGVFTHSTGHGIGLDIHEYPFISSRSEMIIDDGMVFSIEPGIYIPNKYGVRIEDLVVIKNGRAEVI